jgi:tetratricopeptide (TPR) repeat protein
MLLRQCCVSCRAISCVLLGYDHVHHGGGSTNNNNCTLLRKRLISTEAATTLLTRTVSPERQHSIVVGSSAWTIIHHNSFVRPNDRIRMGSSSTAKVTTTSTASTIATRTQLLSWSPRRCSYSTYVASTRKMMPIKTVQVLSLPGFEDGIDDDDDDDDKEVENRIPPTATVLEIYLYEGQTVMAGDNVMVLQRKGKHRSSKNGDDLLFVATPVSGIVQKHYRKLLDAVRVGNKLFDIDTMEEEEEEIHLNMTQPITEGVNDDRKKNSKVQPAQLTKQQLQEYRLVQNEVDSIQDTINQITTTNDNVPGPNDHQALHEKVQLYERILTIQKRAYESTIQKSIATATTELERMQYEKMNDHDPFNIVSTHDQLGQLFSTMHRFENAQSHFKQAMVHARRKNRAADFNCLDVVADALMQLGTVKYKLANYEGAKRDMQEALKLQTRLYGHGYHPVIGETVRKLGNVHYELGLYEEALHSYELTLDIYREVANQSKRKLATTKILGLSDDTKESRPTTRFTIDAADVLHGISAVKEVLGDRKSAIDFAQQELRIRKALLPPDDASIASCHVHIGDLVVGMGGRSKKNPPLEHYELARNIYETRYGTQHRTVAMVHLSIGALHLQLRQFDEAYTSYKTGAEILEATEEYVYMLFLCVMDQFIAKSSFLPLSRHCGLHFCCSHPFGLFIYFFGNVWIDPITPT